MSIVLPRVPIAGAYQLPQSIFKSGDPFVATYQQFGREAIDNYSLYYEVCQRLQPRSIFEIGVRAGYSAYAMLSGSPPGTLYRGLDLNQGTHGGEVDYIDHAKQILTERFPDGDIKIVCGDSQQFRHLDRRFDLCHVDGDHTYEGALHDLELCAPYADYVLVDDVGFKLGVHDAVGAFLHRYASLEASAYESWRGHVLIKTANIGR